MKTSSVSRRLRLWDHYTVTKETNELNKMSLEHHFSNIPEIEGAGTTLVLGWRGLIRAHYCLFRQHFSGKVVGGVSWLAC